MVGGLLALGFQVDPLLPLLRLGPGLGGCLGLARLGRLRLGLAGLCLGGGLALGLGRPLGGLAGCRCGLGRLGRGPLLGLLGFGVRGE